MKQLAYVLEQKRIAGLLRHIRREFIGKNAVKMTYRAELQPSGELSIYKMFGCKLRPGSAFCEWQKIEPHFSKAELKRISVAVLANQF